LTTDPAFERLPPMTLRYPKFLESTLGTSHRWRSAVDGTISDFDDWLRDSKLPFFPDYTDHGTDHLNKVMLTASELIREDAKPFFSTADAAILILSILLHDSAMHISESGFFQLIKGSAKDWRIEGFDSERWPNIWDEFLFAAKRWDDRTLVDVIGETTSGLPRATIRDPFDHYDNLAESDRRLIGEFIRRHHPRMAHEFAVFGVPGPSAHPIKPSTGFEPDHCDIGGLIARSHGLSVRQCLEYLSAKYDRREYQNIHAVFLMTLLRVGDNLQIESERSTPVIFRYKHVPSPLSEREHKVHHAIKNITRTHDDPESIWIQAQPGDVRTLLRIQEWLLSIQVELDASWAVLGEVYSLLSLTLSNFGLIIRRVRSNLDNLMAIAKVLDFVPKRIAFDVARPDLLRLLVRPLYGDRPEMGVRELVQNAVDAVRELKDLCEHDSGEIEIHAPTIDGDVEVWLDDPDENGSAWLKVTDCGVGMTEDVVQDYFLTAGASFRNSDEWHREHDSKEAEQSAGTNVKARVLRSGRFGIGVLAAFLLGNEIEVKTRHVRASRGIYFKCSLDSDVIELQYVDNIPTGTSIGVRVSEDTFGRLTHVHPAWRHTDEHHRWDWYSCRQPRVVRLFGSSRQTLPQRFTLPGAGEDLPPTHHRLALLDYADVQWTYDGQRPSLTCNGIIIGSWDDYGRFDEGHHGDMLETQVIDLSTPAVSVFDPDGNLPLTLQRDKLAARTYPFSDQLVTEVLKDVIAQIFVDLDSLHSSKQPEERDALWMRSHPAIARRWHGFGYLMPFMARSEGLALVDADILAQCAASTALIFSRYDSRRAEFNVPLTKPFDLYLAAHWDSARYYSIRVFRGIFEYGDRAHPAIPNLFATGKRILTCRPHAEMLMEHKEIPKFVKKGTRYVSINDYWSFLEIGKCLPTHFDIDALKAISSGTRQGRRAPFQVELFLTPRVEDYKPSRIAELWWQIIGQPTIPFDQSERSKVLQRALPFLGDFIERYKAQIQSKDK